MSLNKVISLIMKSGKRSFEENLIQAERGLTLYPLDKKEIGMVLELCHSISEAEEIDEIKTISPVSPVG
tara:strand:- start:3010 stop:3216 length:207 start_codon:yes stop_codon:yes gene_type:complete